MHYGFFLEELREGLRITVDFIDLTPSKLLSYLGEFRDALV